MACGDWTLFVRADCWQGTGDDAAGASCDPFGFGDCDPQFVFCLRPYGHAGTNEDDCPLGRVETGEFDSGDAFCFGNSYIDQPANVPNPIVFSNGGAYPVRNDKWLQNDAFPKNGSLESICLHDWVYLYLTISVHAVKETIKPFNNHEHAKK